MFLHRQFYKSFSYRLLRDNAKQILFVEPPPRFGNALGGLENSMEFPCRFAQQGAKHRAKFFFKFIYVVFI